VKDAVAGTIRTHAKHTGCSAPPRAAAKKGRCLIPLSAGYEWQFAGMKKSIAHAFGVIPRGALFAVAGLIDNGIVALITCSPNQFMAALHHRMPANLAPAQYEAWLCDGDLDLLRPFDGEMYACAVDKALLKDHDGPECLAEFSASSRSSGPRWRSLGRSKSWSESDHRS